MKEPPTNKNVSCRNFRWIFDLCTERHINPQRILKHVPYPKEHLRDPAAFIDWNSFLVLFSNLGNYLSDEQLIEAGKESWEHPTLRPYTVVGKMLLTAKDQFLSIFGPLGILQQLYPVSMAVQELQHGHLQFSLTMREELLPCRAFQAIVAGQLKGLPISLGESPAEVITHHTQRGATYDVWFQPGSNLLGHLRKALKWPVTARESARELAVAFDALLAQYRHSQELSTKYTLAERRARESEVKYRLLEHNVKDVLFSMDLDLKIKYISASVHALIGYTRDEIPDMDPATLFSEESLEKIKHVIDAATGDEPEHESRLEIELMHKNGSHSWAELRTNFVLDDHGRPIHLIGVVSDISERKSFEAHLNEREESYRAITTNAQDAIITVNQHNRITFANPATTRIFGYDSRELEGMSLDVLMPTAGLGDQPESEPAHDSETIAIEGRKKDGTAMPLEASFADHSLHSQHYVTWIVRDVTFRTRIEQERRLLEQQLHAVQRMESIGQLTGGIAHDFNNLLVAINGYADLGLARDVPAEKQRQYLQEIRQAGERAADMTQKLLAFSRRQIIEPSFVNVNELIKGIKTIIDRLLPENIEVRFFPALQDPSIVADAGQIEQVIVNLAVNARDAMPDGGTLLIAIDQRTVTKGGTSPDYVREGEFVVIRVEDSGTGMPDDVRKRIFEPFFTTKPEGSGTGLGMAVAFGIVKQHDGYIEVESQPEQGTRFEIFLPVAERRRPPARKTRDSAEPTSAGGTEMILLVEDNLQVRDLARLVLTGAGYKVTEARDGIEALDIFERHATDISLVIMDVVMPRMGGKEVMTRLRSIDPDVRILFTSGYSNGGIHTNFILEEGLAFLPKPYGANTLRSKVRQILDASAGKEKRISFDASATLSSPRLK